MNERHSIRVSYILITKNRAEFLERALQNIREFIGQEDELVIMDGGSTDTTPDVLERYSGMIAYHESREDYGPVHALNKAILKSRGRYIVNVSDDDYRFPDGMRKAIDVMEEHPEIDALLCGGEWLVQYGASEELKLLGFQYLPEGKTLAPGLSNCRLYTPTGFYVLRRDVVARVGLFDPVFHAACDLEYSSRLLLCKTNLRYLNVKMFRHISRPMSFEQRRGKEAGLDVIRIAIRHGAWDLLNGCSWHEVCAALNLDSYRWGGWTVDLIRHRAMLERHKGWGGVLSKAAFRGILLLMRFMAFVSTHIDADYGPHARTVIEPNWDGALR